MEIINSWDMKIINDIAVNGMTFATFHKTAELGDIVTFICSLSFRAHSDDIEMELSVYDDSGFYYMSMYDAAQAQFYEMNYHFKFLMVTTGLIPFECKWTYWTRNARGLVLKHYQTKNSSMTIFGKS